MGFEQSRPRRIRLAVVAGVASLALVVESGCAAENATEQEDTDAATWTLREGAEVYDSAADAMSGEPCTILDKESTVEPETTQHVPNGRTVIEIEKTDPDLHLVDPGACEGNWVYTEVK